MNDRDWTILATIAEEKNITKSADRLYISQPSLTYRIQALESEFGTGLLIRTPNGVILTPQGEYLVEYARDMLKRLAAVKERLAGFEGQVKGPLRIGSSAIFANYELPQILREFHDLHPGVEFYLKTGMSGQVARLLEREEVTVAILRGEHEWKYDKRLLMVEPVCLVSRSPLRIEDLPDRPRIVYGTDSSLRGLVDEWWRLTFKRKAMESMEVDTMDACKRMVLQDLGWAILPSIGLAEYDELRATPLRWPDGSPLIRRTWLLSSSYAESLPVVRAFVDFVSERFERRKPDPARP